jgi:hypothetical protein
VPKRRDMFGRLGSHPPLQRRSPNDAAGAVRPPTTESVRVRAELRDDGVQVRVVCSDCGEDIDAHDTESVVGRGLIMHRGDG